MSPTLLTLNLVVLFFELNIYAHILAVIIPYHVFSLISKEKCVMFYCAKRKRTVRRFVLMAQKREFRLFPAKTTCYYELS